MTVHHGSLPTLTEVIDIEADVPVQATGPVSLPPESLPLDAQPLLPADQDAMLTTQALEALRPRIDALLEARLQAAMAPPLARLVDDLVHQLRGELASAMQALVAQAVDEVLSRRRKP